MCVVYPGRPQEAGAQGKAARDVSGTPTQACWGPRSNVDYAPDSLTTGQEAATPVGGQKPSLGVWAPPYFRAALGVSWWRSWVQVAPAVHEDLAPQSHSPLQN